MKAKLTILLVLFSAMPLQAGIFDWWTKFWGYRSTLNSIQRKITSDDLKDAAAQVKKNLEPSMKQARKDSNDALLEEIGKPGISDYFNQSKPQLSTKGIFNTSEVAFLLHEMRQKKEEMNKVLQSEEVQAMSEKPRKMSDVRELPHLGKCEHEPRIDKYLITFTTNLTSQNKTVLRISLAEQIKATKRMANRTTGNIEEVPCAKKLVKKMFVGVEQENGRFEWQKIDNANQATEEISDSQRRVRFTEKN